MFQTPQTSYLIESTAGIAFDWICASGGCNDA